MRCDTHVESCDPTRDTEHFHLPQSLLMLSSWVHSTPALYPRCLYPWFCLQGMSCKRNRAARSFCAGCFPAGRSGALACCSDSLQISFLWKCRDLHTHLLKDFGPFPRFLRVLHKTARNSVSRCFPAPGSWNMWALC